MTPIQIQKNKHQISKNALLYKQLLENCVCINHFKNWDKLSNEFSRRLQAEK